ncbi:MAG TPA: hypothetical protein VK668_07570 [Mucilaginibacter sp.]|nr:hypothetical protein [Mucilaginibacter sp.]
MLNYFTLNTIVEIICFVVALICLVKDKSLAWRSMVLFLFITCVAELMGIHVKRLYLADRAHVHPNLWLYNILLIFQAGFISLVFYHLLNKYSNSKPLILSGLALLAVIYIYEIVAHGIFKFNNLTNTVMSVMFVFYSLYYYYHLLKHDAYVNLKYEPAFWWIAGTLFFYFGITACNLFFDKLSTIVITPKHYLTYYIYNTLNIILYGCWSYSFICRKWLTRISEA